MLAIDVLPDVGLGPVEQGVDAKVARRIIDFASGLCYGKEGQMERITSQVYLLTPSDVEVSAEDRRRLEDDGPLD